MRRHAIYRSIEGTAHGYLSWLPYELAIIIAVGVSGTSLVNPIVGMAAAAAVGVLLILGRRLSHGRRNYLALWVAGLSGASGHLRMLDPDAAYVPYVARGPREVPR